MKYLDSNGVKTLWDKITTLLENRSNINVMSENALTELCQLNQITFNNQLCNVKYFLRPIPGGVGASCFYRIYLNRDNIDLPTDINLYAIGYDFIDNDDNSITNIVYIAENLNEDDKNNIITATFTITLSDAWASTFVEGLDPYNMTIDPYEDETR